MNFENLKRLKPEELFVFENFQAAQTLITTLDDVCEKNTKIDIDDHSGDINELKLLIKLIL